MEQDNSLIQNIPCDCATIQRHSFNVSEALATPINFLHTAHEKNVLACDIQEITALLVSLDQCFSNWGPCSLRNI